ncbi:MAG: RNA polymerase sigma factor [Bacteroidota bacterium]
MGTTQYNIHSDLIEACKRGDRTAQFRLYQLYNRAMYNLCIRMLGDQAAAEDALQEAFVNAFSNIHRFEGRSSVGAWIKRITVNKCLSILNKRKLFFEALDERVMNLEEDKQEAYIWADISPARVHQEIKKLPEGCRVIFNLYQLEGYDHQEISEILGVSVSTSKSQFHRARKLLRERLAKELEAQ